MSECLSLASLSNLPSPQPVAASRLDKGLQGECRGCLIGRTEASGLYFSLLGSPFPHLHFAKLFLLPRALPVPSDCLVCSWSVSYFSFPSGGDPQQGGPKRDLRFHFWFYSRESTASGTRSFLGNISGVKILTAVFFQSFLFAQLCSE